MNLSNEVIWILIAVVVFFIGLWLISTLFSKNTKGGRGNKSLNSYKPKALRNNEKSTGSFRSSKPHRPKVLHTNNKDDLSRLGNRITDINRPKK